MNRSKFDFARLAFALLFALGLSAAQAQPTPPRTDLTKDPTLYLVGYAHLDTEWRWEYPQVISEYLAKTMQWWSLIPARHSSIFILVTRADWCI